MAVGLLAGDMDAIRNTLVFGGLGTQTLDNLIADATVRECGRGEMLFVQGEPASYFFVVLDGWIKVYRITSAGEEAIVGTFTRGQTFAEAAAFTGGQFPASAEAVTEARILRIPARRLFDQIMKSPEIGLAMLASTSQHLHLLVRQVEQLKAHTGAQRVAEFLVSLAPAGAKGSCVIALPYDKTLLAGKLGLKPESLSRAFQRLKRCGVTMKRDKAVISDIACLVDFKEQERAEVMRPQRNNADRLEAVFGLIDEANSRDPSHSTDADGRNLPAALLYGQRMSTRLQAFDAEASEELGIACRAQHLERWLLPRADYPQTKAGYFEWRNEQKKRHAERVSELKGQAGYDKAACDRVAALVRKEGIKRDPESQMLEDVACLVFLENHAVEFADGREEEQVIDILKKTLRKMSDRGRKAALDLPLHPGLRSAIDEAIEAGGVA